MCDLKVEENCPADSRAGVGGGVGGGMGVKVGMCSPVWKRPATGPCAVPVYKENGNKTFGKAAPLSCEQCLLGTFFSLTRVWEEAGWGLHVLFLQVYILFCECSDLLLVPSSPLMKLTK